MKKKILIIEDETILGEMYKDKLTSAGFEVFWSLDVEDGIKTAKEQKPDLVLLDILLPRESGLDFLEKTKEDKEISKIPVLVFSNYDDPAAKAKALKLGAKEYLIKTSFSSREMLDKVKQYL